MKNGSHYCQKGHIIFFENAVAMHVVIVEFVYRFGGSQYILRVCPVANLNASNLKDIILTASSAINRAGRTPILFICDY